MDLHQGLSDRYAVERTLGQGGMATVWLARDLRYDRQVALKVLDAMPADRMGAERFLREVALAARLQHPHIVSVYDSGETAGRLWFTMPYIEGESVRDRLKREGALAPAEAARIAREAARALQYAHEQGVIHRDVKPENILLTHDGSSMVADFGIARPQTAEAQAQHLTTTGLVVGTPLYMSPEQAGGSEAVDARSDVYSLGCTLYEMLTGEPPFRAESVHGVIVKHLTVAPTLRGGAASRIPVALRAVLGRALAKSPSERYPTAAAFERALGDVAETVGARRARLPLILAGLLLVVGIGVLLARSGGVGRGGATTMAGGSVASGFARRLAQLTFSEGVEEWPAWAPDGVRLAYTAEVDGVRQLFVRDTRTGTERRVTTGTRDDIQPAWSPDGRRLAFVRATADRGKLEPTDINGWYQDGGDVWILDLSSGSESKVVENAFGPSWAPAGRGLAFDATWAGPRRIWVADTTGRNPRQVTSDSSEAVIHAQAQWSPDGHRLVFRRQDKSGADVATAEPGSGSLVRLTADNMLDIDPAWSPDGRRIYLASNRGGGLNLWRIPVGADGRADGPAEQVTTGAGDDVEPAIAPDGRRVVFAVRGINADLWRLPVSPATGQATGQPAALLTTSRVESRGAWSPDGRRIAFNSDRLGEMNIWVRELDNGAERQVTRGAGGDYQPAWTPDGRELVFFSARGGNADIWRVAVADGRLVRLTDDRSLDTNPFPSPDGRSIGFLSDRSGRLEVWLMSADGTGQRQLTSVGAGGHFLRWTADGAAIIFRAETGSQIRTMRVTLADGAVTQLRDVASGAHMSLSPSEEVIMDVRGHKTLWAYPLDGRPASRVFEFPDPDVRIDYPTWSPDGRWVLFDRAAPLGGDLWIMEGLE
jgi:eukaryotic-like serine/threonine-protein kinase